MQALQGTLSGLDIGPLGIVEEVHASPLAKPLAECGLIPRPIMAMISVAEESNNLDNVLVNVADTVDRKTVQSLDVMVRLIEPIMLLVMGSLILFVMMALLLPVFEMSTQMG